jgi:hypothetical protein
MLEAISFSQILYDTKVSRCMSDMGKRHYNKKQIRWMNRVLFFHLIVYTIALTTVSILYMTTYDTAESGIVFFMMPFFYGTWVCLFVYGRNVLRSIQTMTGFGVAYIIGSGLWLYYIQIDIGLNLCTGFIGFWGFAIGIFSLLLFWRYMYAPQLRRF